MANRDFPLAPTPDPNQNDKGKKTQKKLPSGASSVSAEKDYAESERLRNSTKNLTGKQVFDMVRAGKKVSDIYQKSDSLRREGDRKTKATGGVIKSNRLN